VNYAKLLEMNSFFLALHSFLEVGKTQDLLSKFWQTLGDALRNPIIIVAVDVSQPPRSEEGEKVRITLWPPVAVTSTRAPPADAAGFVAFRRRRRLRLLASSLLPVPGVGPLCVCGPTRLPLVFDPRRPLGAQEDPNGPARCIKRPIPPTARFPVEPPATTTSSLPNQFRRASPSPRVRPRPALPNERSYS
jgi:hypothetical protein